MKTKQGIAAILGFALMVMVPASGGAAEDSGPVMADITARLMQAETHAAALQEALDDQVPLSYPPATETALTAQDGHDIGPWPQGGGHPAPGSHGSHPAWKVTPAMRAALDGLEATVRDAQGLAGGHAYLEPGIEHVLTNAGRIRANADPSLDADALSHEIAIELQALANNARVLQAEADLRAASVALRGNRSHAFQGHLEAAKRVMTEARDRGAYHLEDDLATLQVVLTRVKHGASPHEAVTADAVDTLIGDIHEHLADLGGD